MQTWGIIVAGALIAGAIFYTASQQRYAISGDGGKTARIDTRTGAVSFCTPVNFDVEPVCSPFGAQTLKEYNEQ